MNNTKQLGVGAVVAIIIGIVFYVAGFWHAANRASATVHNLTSELNSLQTKVTTMNNQDQMLHARLDLFKAAGDMDQRNFGLANGHLKEASAALAAVDARSAGVNPTQLGILLGQLGNFNVTVATDLEAQRTQVLEFGNQLDALMAGPAATSPSATTPAAAPGTAPATTAGEMPVTPTSEPAKP